MKKIFTAIAALMLAFAPLTHMSAQNSTSQNSTSQANVNGHLSLETVVKKYKDIRNADYVKMDGIILGMAKLAMKSEGELPASAVDALKKMTVMDLDDCTWENKDAFRKDMTDALAGCELVLEANDEDDKVSIYVGKMTETYFEDFIIYESKDCDLVIMHGKFPVEALRQMVEENID